MPLGQRLARVFRVGRPRRASQASPTRNLSLAQSLPDELILAILSHLSHDGLLGQHTYPISHLAESSRAIKAKEAALCQQGLYSATLSCRSWYSAGIELLYSSPIVLSKRGVELLLRTLTTSPRLSGYVNDLYAPLVAHKSPLAWLQNTLSIKGGSADTEDGAHLVTRLARTTSVLNTLSLKHVVPSGQISTVPLFSISFPSELEHLTIHGTSFESQNHPQFCLLPSHDTSTPISYNTLQTLCLRDMYILPTVKFPHMPQLHHVALVQNHYFQSFAPAEAAPPLLTGTTFPSLRTLDIYGDDIPCETPARASLNRVADESVLYNLCAFTLVQAVGHLEGTLSMISNAFDNTSSPNPSSAINANANTSERTTNLRSLTIGVIGSMDCAKLEKWRIPPGVERLTLLLSCGQPAYTRAEVNSVRRSQSLSRTHTHTHTHGLGRSLSRTVTGGWIGSGYGDGDDWRERERERDEEGRRLVRSVFKCLEWNLHHLRSGVKVELALRELCLVVGPGVLSAPGDAERVREVCRAGKTGLSVIYQDPDSCVAEMLVSMETRSASAQTRLARMRSNESKFVDVQHLDYTPPELRV